MSSSTMHALVLTWLLLGQAELPVEFAARPRALPEEAGQALAAVDWDGDGDRDLLCVTRVTPAAGELVWLVNDGHARFGRVTGVSFLEDRPQIVAGDVRGDALPEGLLTSTEGSFWIVSEARGGMGLLPGPLPGSTDAALADLDRDGRLDALARTEAGLVWSRNLGQGLFDLPRVIAAAPPTLGDRLALSDLDRDGDVDLLCLRGRSGLALFFNDGHAGFSRVLVLNHAQWNQPAGLVAALDVDGNGFDDLVLAPAQDTLLLYLNLDGATFVAANDRLPAGLVASTLTAFDPEADGDQDLLIGTRWLRNDGGGHFEALRAPLSSDRFLAGDYDRDGDVDLVARGELLLGNRTGAFELVLPETRLEPGLALGDVDDDGDLDAAGAHLYGNDGSGHFTQRVSGFPSSIWGGWDPHFGDFDQDGDMDFLHAGFLVPLANDGAGNFTELPCAPPEVYGAAGETGVGDFDGDGDLDLFLVRSVRIHCEFSACYLPAPDILRTNDGHGCLSVAPTAIPPFADVGVHLALGDLDRDGDLDVVTDGARILRNEGGAFVDVWALGSRAVAPVDVALGDLDLDGDLDVLFAGESDVLPLRDRFGTNDGTGDFPTLVPLPFSSRSVELLDLEGDGDLDLVRSQGAPDLSRELVVERNDRPTWTSFPQRVRSGPPTSGDVDRDGDIDLLTDQVLENRHRSLTLLAPVRRAQPFAFELTGPARGLSWLVAATALAPVATPFGLRQLDPRHLVYAKSGRLDGAGRERRELAVPTDPALVGLVLHWQGLVGPPLRWTNHRTTPIGGY